jgi:hypothetical protein
MKNDSRPKQNAGPVPKNPRDIELWNSRQVRLAGAWSKHEVEAESDPLCAPYGWVPDWIGDMTAREVNAAVCAHYGMTP